MKRSVKKGILAPIKWTAALINIVLVILFVASAWGGIVNPNTSVIAAGMALMFPIFLVLMLVALVANLIWFRKMAVVNIIALLLCGGQVLNYCPINLPKSEESVSRGNLLKVLSFNVFGFKVYGSDHKESTNPTLDYILNADADIVLLQEADGLTLPHMVGIPGSQCQKLDSIYPYHDITYRGMAIYSKYPVDVVPIRVRDKAQLDLCRYDVTLPDSRVVHLFNVHMQSIGLTAEDKQLYVEMTSGEAPADAKKIRSGLLSKLAAAFRLRAKQAHEIREALDSVDGDVILAGDFNDVPGSYACLTVKGDDMADAYRESALWPAITYHANRFYFRIDHIFYRGGLDAIRTQRGDCYSSDHYPLLTTFKLN